MSHSLGRSDLPGAPSNLEIDMDAMHPFFRKTTLAGAAAICALAATSARAQAAPFSQSFVLNSSYSSTQLVIPAGKVLTITGVSGNMISSSSHIVPYLAIAFLDGTGNAAEIDLVIAEHAITPVTFDSAGPAHSYIFNHLLNAPFAGGCIGPGTALTLLPRTTIGSLATLQNVFFTVVGTLAPDPRCVTTLPPPAN
jgi:hypothetical protein